MKVNDFGYMLIRHSEERQLLWLQWKPGRSLLQLKAGLRHLLDMARRHKISRIILDLHHMPDIDVQEQAWISLTWLPRMAALPLTQVALILPSCDLYNQMVAENILWREQAQIRVDIQFFSEADEALGWLTTDESILPTLRRG